MKINKKMIQKIVLGTLVMSAALLIGTAAMAADTGVWTTLSVTGSVGENLTLNVDEELRFSDITDPSLARQHTDISLGVRINDILSLSSGYRNTSTGEHRPYVGLGLSLIRGDLDVDSVTKLELRDLDSVRARTEVNASLNVTSDVTVWVADEVFVDSSGITGNRASTGVTKGLNDTFGVSVYYLLDSSIGDATSHSNVIGLGIVAGL